MYMTLKKLFKLLGRRIPTQAEVLGNLEVINTDDIPASELADYFEDKEKIRELGKYVLLKLIVFLICWIFFSCIGIYVQYKMWGIKDGKDGDTKSSSVKGDPALDDTFFETHN